MSQAFMREKEEEWLGDVAPTVAALERYLTKENDTKIFEIQSRNDAAVQDYVHRMSNGSSYALDLDKRWYMV